MKTRISTVFVAALLALGTTGADVTDPGFIALQADDIELTPLPDRPDIAVALLVGNPNETGTYVMRIRFGPDVTSSPHYHDQDRLVTVISGVWAFGTGESGACEETMPLMAGAFAMHPKGAVHYDGSCNGEEVVVQIIGTGPVETTWLGANE